MVVAREKIGFETTASPHPYPARNLPFSKVCANNAGSYFRDRSYGPGNTLDKGNGGYGGTEDIGHECRQQTVNKLSEDV